MELQTKMAVRSKIDIVNLAINIQHCLWLYVIIHILLQKGSRKALHVILAPGDRSWLEIKDGVELSRKMCSPENLQNNCTVSTSLQRYTYEAQSLVTFCSLKLVRIKKNSSQRSTWFLIIKMMQVMQVLHSI